MHECVCVCGGGYCDMLLLFFLFFLSFIVYVYSSFPYDSEMQFAIFISYDAYMYILPHI